MSVAVTQSHRALAEVVRSFARANEVHQLARDALRDPAMKLPAIWSDIAAQGWLGLHVAEEFGGSGFELAETAVVASELGRVISPGPFLTSVVTSAALASVGSAHCRQLLPGLVDGSRVPGLGLSGRLRRNALGKVAGDAGLVMAGTWATTLFLRADDDLLVIDRAAPGMSIDPAPSVDSSLGLAKVSFADGVPVSHVLVVPNAGSAALEMLRIFAGAEAAGGARAILDMAVEYAKVREQFGRPVGSFQAVKHHLADMLTAAEISAALSWDAARAEEPDQRGFSAAAAARSIALYQENTQKAIQVFGGIGFTWEHDAHLYLRRSVALARIADSAGPADLAVYELAATGVRRTYDVRIPASGAAYRQSARAFLARYRAAPEEARRRLLAESGYLAPHWPPPFGRGAGPVEQLVAEEELREVDYPSLGIGAWVLPTLIQAASPQQLERWILPSLTGELRWCQLFSEPSAGSDAAAIRTSARHVEGGWRVTGQKVWTSFAHLCDRGLATVRTDASAAKHKGITTMVIDMHARGVETRPLREITGDQLFSEVFLNDVYVPDEDVVGDVNEGWKVARATLGNERVSIGGTLGENLSAYELIELSGHRADNRRREVARLIADEHALRLIGLRRVVRSIEGLPPSAEGDVTKLLTSEHAQRVAELALELVGPEVLAGERPRVWWHYLYARCLTIAGGTSEIGRNVIAERILGLEREPALR